MAQLTLHSALLVTMAASTEHWSEDLFGPKILKKPKTTGVPTVPALKGKKLVALYFSASWYVSRVQCIFVLVPLGCWAVVGGVVRSLSSWKSDSLRCPVERLSCT